MQIIGLLVVIITLIASYMEKHAGESRKSARRGSPSDWKKMFEKTPSKLDQKPVKPSKPEEPSDVPSVREIVRQTLEGTKIVDEIPEEPVNGEKKLTPRVEGSIMFVDWDKDSTAEIKGPVVTVSEPELEKERRVILEELTDPLVLKKAMLYKEILGQPRALNPWRRH